MQTLYRLNATELDDNFLQAVKSLFKDKSIEITICEAQGSESTKTIGQAIEQFRKQVTASDLEPDDNTFADIRDRSIGREVLI